MNLINKLRELESKASPGPWTFIPHPNPGQWINGDEENNWQSWSFGITYRIIPPDYDEFYTICDDEQYCNSAPKIEDAELMAEMRNALVPLLDRLEKLEEENTGLREAIALADNPEAVEPGFWGRVCARLSIRNKKLEVVVEAANRAYEALADGAEYEHVHLDLHNALAALEVKE